MWGLRIWFVELGGLILDLRVLIQDLKPVYGMLVQCLDVLLGVIRITFAVAIGQSGKLFALYTGSLHWHSHWLLLIFSWYPNCKGGQSDVGGFQSGDLPRINIVEI